jgi:hypothetical protein
MTSASRRVLFLAGLALSLRPGVAATQRVAADPSPRMRLVAQIGGDLVADEYAFSSIADISVSSAGSIYVLDYGDKAVKVFDPSGRFQRKFGREGGGPGEFTRPTGLRVDSVVRVFDTLQQRAVVFTLQGIHRETPELPSLPGVTTEIVPLRGGGALGLAGASFSPGRPGHQPNYTAAYRAPNGTLQTLLSFPTEAALWRSTGSGMWGLLTTPFGAGGAVATSGDSMLAVANGYSAEVVWYRADGRGLSAVRRDTLRLNAPLVSAQDLESAEKEWRATLPGPLGRIEIDESPARWSVASRALFAHDGTLWVRSSADPDAGLVWTVLRENGQRVIRMPPGFDLRAIHGNRLYGIWKTANDAEMVRVFEWAWH